MSRQIGNLTLYSVDDLHRQLGLSKMTIRSYLRDGRLRGRKLGVKWYVTESALEEYFEEGNTEEPGSSGADGYYYIVKGTNDLVSEQERCQSIEETVECIGEQAIVSLFQVAVVDRQTDHIVELVKARDFVERHRQE